MSLDKSQQPQFVQAYAVEPTGVQQNVQAQAYNSSLYPQTPIYPAANGPSQNSQSTINEAGARQYLSSKKWPIGLVDACVKSMHKMPIRYMIVDDSGSMACNDGSRMVDNGNHKKEMKCTRWSELTNALRFHAGLANASNAATEFRLLNQGLPTMIGGSSDPNAYDKVLSFLDGSPSGGTPLCHHIREVVNKIRSQEQQLRQNNQMACVVIASDGESSDGDVAQAMAPLKNLPAWVVIRLCTDDSRIVTYWNQIDEQLELNMDVLDDLKAEGEEVTENNPWLTYGEPLHRLREFGIIEKEIDCLDEARLSSEQARKLCWLIYGGELSMYPIPEVDPVGFLQIINDANKRTGMVYSPNKRKNQHWVNPKALTNPGGCSIS